MAIIEVNKTDTLGFITASGIAVFQTVGKGNLCIDIGTGKECNVEKKPKIVRSIRWDKNLSDGLYEGILKPVVLKSGVCFLTIDNAKKVIPKMELRYKWNDSSVRLYKVYGEFEECLKYSNVDKKEEFCREYNDVNGFDNVISILEYENKIYNEACGIRKEIKDFLKNINLPLLQVVGSKNKVSYTDNFFSSNESDEDLKWEYSVDTVIWNGVEVEVPRNIIDIMVLLANKEGTAKVCITDNTWFFGTIQEIKENVIKWIETNKHRLARLGENILIF